MSYVPRLRSVYETEVRNSLQEEYSYSNVM
jgi:hypothetical protein